MVWIFFSLFLSDVAEVNHQIQQVTPLNKNPLVPIWPNGSVDPPVSFYPPIQSSDRARHFFYDVISFIKPFIIHLNVLCIQLHLTPNPSSNPSPPPPLPPTPPPLPRFTNDETLYFQLGPRRNLCQVPHHLFFKGV